MQMVERSSSDFFTAGGTMRTDSPSYVRRLADDELFDAVLAGEFCYVLTARQMGKSSLMVRTARRLVTRGFHTAIVDLTQTGAFVTEEEWYLGLLTRLKSQLRISMDPQKWWFSRASLTPIQRFTDYLRYAILDEIQEPVAIFIDEIDSTLSLDFTDDFFVAIRAAYNARASDPTYERLTFILLGVATPPDLIQDRTRTPFNIGRQIDLRELNKENAQVLQQGLQVALSQDATDIFNRIFYWTNGHPFLTQRLCVEIVGSGQDHWTEAGVDELVTKLFLDEKAPREANIQSMREYINSSSHKRNLVKLYKQVYHGKDVFEDEQSVLQNQLKLIGLLQIQQGRPPRKLEVRNQIYRHAFNKEWIENNSPTKWTHPVPIAAFAIAALILAVAFITNIPQFILPRAPTPTATLAPSVTSVIDVALSATIPSTSLPSQTPTVVATEVPIVTRTIEPISTSMPTRLPTVPQTPTADISTPTPTPIPTAIANQPAIVFIVPSDRSLQLKRVATNETVEVLGRSPNRFGRVANQYGLYVRTNEGIEGFVIALFFDWRGEIVALPIVQPKYGVSYYYTRLFQMPDAFSATITEVTAGEYVEVLSRSGEEWLYVRIEGGLEGFVERDRINWQGDFNSLAEQN